MYELFNIALIIFAMSSIMGFTASFLSVHSNTNHCLEKPRRIEKFIPAYKLGCFLFGNSGEKYYYEENERGE